METSTEPRKRAEPTTTAQSSRSPLRASWQLFTPFVISRVATTVTGLMAGWCKQQTGLSMGQHGAAELMILAPSSACQRTQAHSFNHALDRQRRVLKSGFWARTSAARR